MTENLPLRLAHRSLCRFADDVLECQDEAMECQDCGDLLKKGVDAWKAISVAEGMFRQAHYEGMLEYSGALKEAIEGLYDGWMTQLEPVERWIASLESRGYRPDHVTEFREATEAILDTIERRDWQRRARNSLTHRVSEEAWDEPEAGRTVPAG